MLTKLIRTYLRRYKKVLLAVLALQIVQTVASLYLPTLNADIIDKGVLKGDTHYIYSLGGIMLLITLVQVVFNVGAVYYGSRVAMGFGRDVRAGLFHQVTDFSAREVGQFGAPSLITRITNDVQQVQMLVLMSCTLLAAAPITIVGGTIMALRQDVPLSGLLLVSIPALVISVGIVVRKLVPQFRNMQERIDTVNRVLREQITGIRVVRAFVREPDEVERFGEANADLTDTSLIAGRLTASMFPVVLFVLNASSVAAVWFGGDRIASGKMQIGALVAFLSYLLQILMSVMLATFVAIMVPRAAVCAERIQEVLDTPSSVVPPSSPISVTPTRASLVLDHVGFHYPGAEAPILVDISLTALAGQTTAIIGSTGSGKTTLVNLVPRLFDATTGSVFVDGVNVRDLDPDILWSRIGLVPQKPYLFSGTVASNLRYADPQATDDELWAALEIAQAKGFVANMPGGLNARIAQGGTNVSGGQRQRLAIARALVRKPSIYLFDDSFSALDSATDARLRAALAQSTGDATLLIVAQRVSTIANADQILVLEDGYQVGLGTHEYLLENCPTYAEIVSSQLTAEEAA
ncbi:MAG: multidrug transporter ATP-binding protein [Acidimicrobiia bacterium]|nr:multidrug transporter ATP-binding protein [Acidimicrobiia bacterium]